MAESMPESADEPQVDSAENPFANRLVAAVRPVTIMLGAMAITLLFVVALVLPAFSRAYQTMATVGGSGSPVFVNLAIALVWIAFVVTILVTAGVLTVTFLAQSETGRARLATLWGRVTGSQSDQIVPVETEEAASDAIMARFDEIEARSEHFLMLFVTVVMGVTIVAIMLPLMGIMYSMG